MTRLVLASGSATRRSILKNAGVEFIVDRPDVDESAIKAEGLAQGLDVFKTADILAVAKAAQVAKRHRGKIVLGADQLLECGGEWFDKPPDRTAAARQIARLSGRTHSLVSAIVALRDGDVIWRTVESADLTMRDLSAELIEFYLDQVGDKASSSVGGYQIEGLGIQLFSAIHGNHFTILGMPLLPLLAFLRTEGIVAK